MKRSRALFLFVIAALIASTFFALSASASGQCTKPPGDEKTGGDCSAASADDDVDDDVKIIKLSAKDFEKTIAGDADGEEDSVTLILFDNGEDRPAISAAFNEVARALDGLGITAATIDSNADSMLSEKQGGGSKKTAVRAFYSARLDKGADKTARKPSYVAAGGPALTRTSDDDDGPLADPAAIAAVAFEALAAAAAARLGVAEASSLLSRSVSTSSSSSSSSKKDDKKKASSKEDEKAKKKKQKEEEQKKKKEQEDKKKKEKKRDDKTKKSKTSRSNGKSNKKKSKKTGRINEGGGYFASASDIDALGDSTFDANVGDSTSTSAWMVMFYAPWCGHCKQLAPEYEKLPQLLATRHGNPDARVAAVDCDTHKQVCSRQGVQGFPTLKFFKAGSKTGDDYRGPRDAESIAAFVAERAPKKPAEIVQLTGNDVLQEACPPAGNSDLSMTADEAAALPRLCLFAFVPDLRDSSASERKRLLDAELRGAIARKFAGRPYAYLWAQANDHPEIEKAFGLGYGFPALVAYVPPDSVRGGPAKIVHLKGAFDSSSIASFVERVRGGGGGASSVEPGDVVASDVEPWDGKDVQGASDGEEEEFSLADLGLDVPLPKDEL